ncbi:hypothetical protein DESA109040_02895 [Deinococcus saxicola]
MEIRADARRRGTGSGRGVGKPELSWFVDETDGVRITHMPSGRILLGQSLHLEGMLNRIRFQLQNGLYPNRVIQAD